MRFTLTVLFFICTFYSCTKKNSFEVDTSSVAVDYTLKRFDVDFYNTTQKTLQNTKREYPYLFPESLSDSMVISKINNKDEIKLYHETQKIYGNLSSLEEELTSLFKHVKYYNASFSAPNVITLLSNIDYDNRVIYADSLLLISLDAYLGKEHSFYASYPKYIKETNTKAHIGVDVAKAIINKQVKNSPNRRFIDKIINEGKKMYLLDLFLPTKADHYKIGYSKDKFNWAVANEEQVWVYFLEEKMLYSTDRKLQQRFIDLAPFSKFYRNQDNLSPGRIGVWVGWQIVRSFMRENDVSLQEFLTMKEEEIFKKSKYKPKQ